MEGIIIDDQPISAGFFSEGKRLTDFVTPDALEVQELYQRLTQGISDRRERITACWKWVAEKVRYVEFVRGRLWVNGKSSVQNDFWAPPELTIHTRVGNCAVKSFLLTSLLRQELSTDQVYCTMGNLYNGKAGGHAWVSLNLDQEYIVESTTPAVPAMVPSRLADRYEPVHYFNDQVVLAVEGKTQLIPFTAVYSSWLSDYLNWTYINGER